MKTGFRSRVLSGFGALVTALLLVVPSIGAQQGGTVTGRVLDAQSRAHRKIKDGRLGCRGSQASWATWVAPTATALYPITRAKSVAVRL